MGDWKTEDNNMSLAKPKVMHWLLVISFSIWVLLLTAVATPAAASGCRRISLAIFTYYLIIIIVIGGVCGLDCVP